MEETAIKRGMAETVRARCGEEVWKEGVDNVKGGVKASGYQVGGLSKKSFGGSVRDSYGFEGRRDDQR